MPGKEIRGRSSIATYPNSSKAYKKGGRIKAAHGTLGGRENLLEELGRVEAKPSDRNRRAEISRVHGELNRGFKGGGIAKRGKGKEF